MKIDPLAPLRNRQINSPVWNIGIILAFPIVILLSLNISLQWGDKTTDKDGNIVYANKISLPGWSAVPFEGIAIVLSGLGAIGIGYGVSTKNTPPPIAPTESNSIPPEQG